MNSHKALEELVLPPNFTSIKKIQEEKGLIGKFVNVIGFIADWMPPTRPLNGGKDWKCTIKMKDLSIQDDQQPFEFPIFAQEPNLPAQPDIRVADVILIRQAKVQQFKGAISLISHYSTQYFVTTLPRLDPANKFQQGKAPHTLRWRPYSVKGSSHATLPPNPLETAYMIRANSAKDISFLTDQEFNRKSGQAAVHVGKEKFKTLKDIKPDEFCDIIGEVVKIFVNNENPVELYLSDYTPNTKFYDYICKDDPAVGEVGGDEYGYMKSKGENTKNWPGPYGKLSILISAWDSQATWIRDNLNLDGLPLNNRQWVLLRNVHIKCTDSNKLEGKLRDDHDASKGKIQVSIMKNSDKDQSSDPNFQRWKEAVTRKQEWWTNHKRKQGEKRKREDADPLKLSGKQRRKLERAALADKISKSAIQLATKLDLNENVRCGFPDIPTMPLKNILEPQELLLPQEHRGPFSPFTNSKYRAHVRVVDYFPERVEDFAVGRCESDLDILSDYSGGEDSDLEEDMQHSRSGKGFATKKWEWRFALQVADASSKNTTEKMWLMVGNHDAQGLLGLEEDAANLREDPVLLLKVKEQLFHLWGDLEERKSALLPKVRSKPPISEVPASSPPRRPGTQPDVDSDDENDMVPTGALKSTGVNGTANDSESKTELAPKNKAFTCCIRQYGVKVEEEDPAKANAGKGQRWQRMFGLFGTHIN